MLNRFPIRHLVKWKQHKDTYTTQWPWLEGLWPQSPPGPHTHAHTRSHSHCLASYGIKAQPQHPSLSSACFNFLCTRWHAHVCAWVCFMNPKGGLSDGGGGVAVPQWEEERSRRALVVLKAVEIHRAADISILGSAAWKDRKQEKERIKHTAVYYNTCCTWRMW